MKKNITCLLLVIIIISIFCLSLTVSSSQTINVKYYIKDKFPCEKIASLDLAGEKKTSVGEELFEQENKEKKDSDYAYEAYNQAKIFIDKREYKKALPYLEIAIKTDISSLKARAYFNIGFCYDKLKTYSKAIEAYTQVIRIYPDYAIAYCNLGVTYGQLGFYKEEIEAYKQAIRIDPDYAMAHYNLGAAYGQLSFHEGAIEAFKQAIRIDPDYAMAHYNLSVAYLQIRDRNSALNEYRILKRLDIDLADKLFEYIY